MLYRYLAVTAGHITHFLRLFIYLFLSSFGGFLFPFAFSIKIFVNECTYNTNETLMMFLVSSHTGWYTPTTIYIRFPYSYGVVWYWCAHVLYYVRFLPSRCTSVISAIFSLFLWWPRAIFQERELKWEHHNRDQSLVGTWLKLNASALVMPSRFKKRLRKGALNGALRGCLRRSPLTSRGEAGVAVKPLQCPSYFYAVVVVVVVVVVLTSPVRHSTTQSVVAGQSLITLEWKKYRGRSNTSN